MSQKRAVHLGATQETLLVPLFARALESRRKHPILFDPTAAEIADSMDWDFARFNQRWRILGCVLRTAMFDDWVRDFVVCHPHGTVIELGAGLNDRFERLDNGSIRWFDLDLPDAVELRREFFHDTDRRTTLAASLVDSDWMAAVRKSPGPYFFVAETVLIYLQESEVRTALSQIAGNFPGGRIAFDTSHPWGVTNGNKDFVRRKMAARFAWGCRDPKTIEAWNIGLRLMESRAFGDVRGAVRSRLPMTVRATFHVLNKLAPQFTRGYLLNLFELVSPL